MKIVIRAGGTGTRLWPMSRKQNPKQFQKIVGDKTMVRNTYDRIISVVDSPADVFISVNKDQEKNVADELPEIKSKNIIIEYDTRNTGPAMCLEVCYLQKYCQPDDIIASLPSDDYISDNEAFGDLLLETEQFIKKHPDYILTPAVKPDYPDTGYTYLKAGKNLQKIGEEGIYEVADVVEKPSLEFLEDLIKTGIYFTHTGMYLWQLNHIAELFKKMQPEMYAVCQEVVEFMSKKKISAIKEIYSQLEKISIESAITDKVSKLAMSVSNRVGWSDLGKWHVIKRTLEKNKKLNLINGQVIINNSANNLIYSTVNKKITVINDINDLVIVDTGDALFVSSMKNSADVKKMVDRIREEGLEKYL